MTPEDFLKLKKKLRFKKLLNNTQMKFYGVLCFVQQLWLVMIHKLFSCFYLYIRSVLWKVIAPLHHCKRSWYRLTNRPGYKYASVAWSPGWFGKKKIYTVVNIGCIGLTFMQSLSVGEILAGILWGCMVLIGPVYSFEVA